MIGRTTTEVFNLLTEQLQSREPSSASVVKITNSGATTGPKRKAKVRAMAAPDPLEKLAVRIEQSELTTEQIAKRAKITEEQIQKFLEGDGEALTITEQDRINAALDVRSEMEATATRIRNLSSRGRSFS